MGQTSSQQTPGKPTQSQFGVIPWLLDTNPRFNVQESSPHSGIATATGNTVTWVSGDIFSLYWVTGGRAAISGFVEQRRVYYSAEQHHIQRVRAHRLCGRQSSDGLGHAARGQRILVR